MCIFVPTKTNIMRTQIDDLREELKQIEENIKYCRMKKYSHSAINYLNRKRFIIIDTINNIK